MYYDIFKAADYLYENRDFFRTLKKDILKGFNKNMIEKHSDEELEQIFMDRARKIIGDIKNGNWS